MLDIVQEKTLQENLARQLCDSVERLLNQVEKVAFWASALHGLAAPIPEYQPDDTAIARYLKPARPPKKSRQRLARRNKAVGAKPASA
jgi:hypothetical protein